MPGSGSLSEETTKTGGGGAAGRAFAAAAVAAAAMACRHLRRAFGLLIGGEHGMKETKESNSSSSESAPPLDIGSKGSAQGPVGRRPQGTFAPLRHHRHA